MNLEKYKIFVDLFKNSNQYKKSKTFKKQLFDLFLRNSECKKYEYIDKEYDKCILNIEWNIGINNIKLYYSSSILYYKDFEYIKENEAECTKKVYYKKKTQKKYYYELDSLKYNNIELLINKIKDKCFLKGDNKDYNCTKYFKTEDIFFVLVSPLLFDELVQDDFCDYGLI